MFNKVNAVVLLVNKFDECVEFYSDTIGLEVKDKDTGFVSFKLDGHELALMEVSVAAEMISKEAIQSGTDGVNRVLLATFVENTEKTYNELKTKGVQFIKPPTKQPWGQITANFKDPEGNIWEISHFVED
jgi:lactoylglutathione lyase